jgi:hypothetical protein
VLTIIIVMFIVNIVILIIRCCKRGPLGEFS